MLRWLLILAIAVSAVPVYELLHIVFVGQPVPRPTIPRDVQTVGHGPALRYAIMGDSTTVAQGAQYSQGYAVATAAYLGKTHTVRWINVGISGARAGDVAGTQLAQVRAFKPDIVLVAVGANDVTHLTPIGSVHASLSATIATLQRDNPKVRIVLTGSPDMGSVPRFGPVARWLAGKRTSALNSMVAGLARDKHVAFAPIAAKTGDTFRRHPELFAADKFHPTAAGYALWTPVLTQALDFQ